MKFLLLAALTGFFSWPYYHRMRTFGWYPVKSYALGLIPSVLTSFGILRVILDADAGSMEGYPNYPNLLTKLTFIAIAVVLTAASARLLFTAKWVEDSFSQSSDVPLGFCLILILLCMVQSCLVANVIIQALL